jgi:hypothetical protein
MLKVEIGNLRKDGILTITPGALKRLERIANDSWGARLSLWCYPFISGWVKATSVRGPADVQNHDHYEVGENRIQLMIPHHHLLGFTNRLLMIEELYGSLVLSRE